MNPRIKAAIIPMIQKVNFDDDWDLFFVLLFAIIKLLHFVLLLGDNQTFLSDSLNFTKLAE